MSLDGDSTRRDRSVDAAGIPILATPKTCGGESPGSSSTYSRSEGVMEGASESAEDLRDSRVRKLSDRALGEATGEWNTSPPSALYEGTWRKGRGP